MQLFPIFTRETQDALYKSFISALGLSVLIYSNGAFAAGTPNTVTVAGITASVPDLETMLINFSTAVPNLMRLVTACSYVMGMFFIIVSVMGMKHLGEMRTMQSREHGFWGPAIELLVGAALIYLPSSVQSVMTTFWVDPNPYAYVLTTGSSVSFANACYTIVQLIGTVAFIRGLLMLQQAGSERAQPHMLSKALSHLVGGVLCINVYGTIQTLEATVGMIT